jgi:cytochrome c-type biogenesis protein CcmH
MRIHLLPLLLALGAVPAAAQASTLADYKFEDPAKEHEFRALIEQIRCLVCQNESLAGSQAELAQDLRQEVYEMMLGGQDREQIVNFLVARYGDFVLYSPPLKPTTYPLWFGPFVLVGIAGFFLARTLLRKKQSRDSELSAQEQERLQRLLAERAGHREAEK